MSNLDTPSDIERRLTEIRDDYRVIKRLLVGSDGDDGALGRLTKLEQRHSFMKTWGVWLTVGIASLYYMVVPEYFRHK